MAVGEGARIAAGLAGIGLAIGLFVAAAIRAERQWREFFVLPLSGAEQGRCRCKACRARPQEPCSDYDGD